MKIILKFAFLFSFLLSSCSVATNRMDPPVNSNIMENQDWSYTGTTGPMNWGNIKKEYATCSNGNQQSPIDIQTTIQKPLPLGINYHTDKFKVIFEKTTIKLIPKKHSNSINIGGKNYELKELHFHTPSEHLINGKQADLEIHFVHEDANHAVAAIGILVNKGNENKEFKKIAEVLQKEKKDQIQSVTLNIQTFIPYNSKRVFYQGSFTTPPCTEGVRWIVFEKPIQFSAKQVQTYREFYYPSSRPIQPINDRFLYESW